MGRAVETVSGLGWKRTMGWAMGNLHLMARALELAKEMGMV